MNNRECNICYKINVDTNKCSISCSLNICDECRYEIIMIQPNSKCPQCKTGVLLNIKKIDNISPEIFHTSREIFNNNFTVPLSLFYPSYPFESYVTHVSYGSLQGAPENPSEKMTFGHFLARIRKDMLE